MENSRFTFKELLAHKKVEIPILQRDYVQGNPNDKKATTVRLDFVEDLINQLSKKHPDLMTLDFIYGKLVDDELGEEQERQEEHLESLLITVSDYANKNGYEIQRSFKRLNSFMSKDTFIPFDGQQRLTTLFLLHYLVYAKRNEDLSFLHQFTYKTRVSSRDFLEALLSNSSDFKSNEVWEHSFVNYIQDRNWFYDFWKYDPTVMSMLVMLDTFRQKFKQFENLNDVIDTVFGNLESKTALSFDYLDIDEHQLDDILYVKMNASGKELTDFEKFKSWLIEYTEDEQNGIFNFNVNWESRLDTTWYDLFWEADKTNTDKHLYQFINKLLVFSFCSKEHDITTDYIKTQQKEKRLIYQQLATDESTPFRFYIEHKLINNDSLDFIWKNLNMFCDSEKYEIYENCIRRIWNGTFITLWKEGESFKDFVIKNISSLNLFQQTFLFAVFNFIYCLEKSDEDFDGEKFFDWLRLIRNLIYNSRIDDDLRFFNAIQSIKVFGDKCLNVKNALVDEKFMDFFPERQRIEEFEKNKDEFDFWRDDLINAENHSYFYGQIGFLLELSKVNEELDLDRFRYFYDQLSRIFSDDNLQNNFLISRSLLSFSDVWMPNYGSNRYLLCLPDKTSARDRDENWRRLFNDPKNREVLIELANLYNEIGSLTSIIEIKKQDIVDWRRLLLEYPEELKYCKQGLLNCSNSGNYIRLLGQSRLSHYHRELRTSILFNYYLRDAFLLNPENYGEMKSDEYCFISFLVNNILIKIYFDINISDFKFLYADSDEEITKLELKQLSGDLVDKIEEMSLYLSII